MSVSAEVERGGRAAVAVTGIGLVSPLGTSLATFQAALRDGTSAIRRDALAGRWLPPPSPGGEAMVARVGEFGAAAIEAGRRRRMPRLGQLAVVAAGQALATTPGSSEPAPVVRHYGRDRVGVVLGTGLGTLDMTLEFTIQYMQGGLGAGSPALFPYTVMNAGAALVAMEYGLLGPNLTVNHRDLSLAESVAMGCDLLACRRADAVLAGGCDELGEWLLHAYARLGVLAAGGAVRPYDRHRRGFCPGEGATLLLLERQEDAERRGAPILASILGIGRGGDDRPRLGWLRPGESPAAAATGAATAVRKSLAAAGLRPDQLDFIAGSGNGTDLDRVETAALRQALGAAAETTPIASVLGQTGEWMTSAGVRLGAALAALGSSHLPGTTCQEPDPESALPGLCLRPGPAPRPVRRVLVPTFAQGGGNVALVLASAC